METESKKSLEDAASDKNHEAYGRGVKLFEQGFYSLAKNEFKAALDYWPEDHQAWMALGNCFDEMKKPIRAEKYFRKALIFCSEQERSGGIWKSLPSKYPGRAHPSRTPLSRG